jgi:hypothetical protein
VREDFEIVVDEPLQVFGFRSECTRKSIPSFRIVGWGVGVIVILVLVCLAQASSEIAGGSGLIHCGCRTLQGHFAEQLSF